MTGVGPLLVGTIAILGLAVVLFVEEPEPGPLTSSHAAIENSERLMGCAVCHTERGLTAGCLDCHTEIAGQLQENAGYHGYLAKQGSMECAVCHADHHGRAFDSLTFAWDDSGRDFKHAHVTFHLTAAHQDQACDACHKKQGTYLGLEQTCTACHENIHGEERFEECTQCHDQIEFVPAKRFDHTPHLSLAQGHRGVACDQCHGKDNFDVVLGTGCADCHEDPHQTPFGQDCATCHTSDAIPWNDAARSFGPTEHARSGFLLQNPHDGAACESCHRGDSYWKRFRKPARSAEACHVCHADPHQDQFGNRACTACHDSHQFAPSQITSKNHGGFALRGRHRQVACDQCHRADATLGATRFVGTSRVCATCHEDPHKNQFAGRTCDECHSETAFLPARYDLKNHRKFALTGAHQAVSCRTCHIEDKLLGARRFTGFDQACKSCHKTPHGGQFRRELTQGDCTTCHANDAAAFRMRPFDHRAAANYVLEGAHAKAACGRCHETTGGVTQYRNTPTRCADCHADVHRGQFKRGERAARCDACHAAGASFQIPKFDHKQTRFPLDEQHKDVSCDECHPSVRQRDGRAVVQYRPLGRHCGDCHDFK